MLVNLNPDSEAMQQKRRASTAPLSPDLELLLGRVGGGGKSGDLDLVRLRALSLAAAALVAPEFRNRVSKGLAVGVEELHPRLELLVECSILGVAAYQKHANAFDSAAEGGGGGRIVARLVPICEKVLEASLALLPAKDFVHLLGMMSFCANLCVVCVLSPPKHFFPGGLLRNGQPVVRRKALEVFNSRMQHRSSSAGSLTTTDLPEEAVASVLGPLADSAMGRVRTTTDKEKEVQETEGNQQLALVALRYVVRHKQSVVCILDFVETR